MTTQQPIIGCERRRFSAGPRLLVLVTLALSAGCAALHPIKGVPASYLPAEYLGPSRDGLRPINPMLLTRSRPAEHLIDAGDVLSVYVPGVLGTATTQVDTIGETPPINFPSDIEMPPTIGFPITVRGDGTISLPQVSSIPVRGLTLAQVEFAIRNAYTVPKQILPVGKERILVSLQRPRDYRVLVVREDSALIGSTAAGIGTINLGNTRRGTARIVSLKAYENDVLHALARVQGADGLPGLDAEGAIYVIRRHPHGGGFGGPAGCGIQPPMLGVATTTYRGAPPVRTVADSQPVIRYQSPSGNYRSSGDGVYGGHSFAAPKTALAAGGRYGAPRSEPAVSATPMNGGITSGRYGAPAGAPGHAVAPPSGWPMQSAPTNWTSLQPVSAQSTAGGRYGAPVRLAQSTSIEPPLYSAPPVMSPSGFPMDGLPQNSGYPPTYGAASPNPIAAPQPQWSQPGTVHGPAWPAQQPVMEPIPQSGAPPVTQPMWTNPGMALPSSAGYGSDAMPTDDYFDTMMTAGLDGTIDGPNVVRIPIRIGPGQSPQINEQDITLEDGDIVFIEARGSEVFYTGGLLGGGQFTLLRDHDLRALEALSIAQSQGTRGGTSRSAGGVSALNQDVTISASKLIVVRKLPDGTSVPIEVDLNRAKRDMTGRENITIQPGDYLYLQYSCIEAVGAFFERHLLEGALFGLATAQFTSNGN